MKIEPYKGKVDNSTKSQFFVCLFVCLFVLIKSKLLTLLKTKPSQGIPDDSLSLTKWIILRKNTCEI